MPKKLKIKISTAGGGKPFLKQLKSFNTVWGNCEFFINEEIDECDLWVVYGGLEKEEKVLCSNNGTLFITTEPPSVKKYSKKFTDQFDVIMTCEGSIKHPNIIYSQQALPWWVGHKMDTGDGTLHKTYDELKSIDTPRKEKLASIIVSNKTFTKGHKERYAFLNKLKQELGNDIDIFGVGHQQINDKWDAIAPYKYHIVIENSSYNDYWTEKLSDAFLGQSYPIYYGCHNIYKYFDKSSLSLIDINTASDATEKIKNVIHSNIYEESITAIAQAKDLILDKYQLFSMLSEYANKNISNEPKIATVLKPESKENFLKKIKNKILK